MDKQWKRSLCLLAVLLVTALTVIPVRAATTSGSLRITLTDRQGRPAGAALLFAEGMPFKPDLPSKDTEILHFFQKACQNFVKITVPVSTPSH